MQYWKNGSNTSLKKIPRYTTLNYVDRWIQQLDGLYPLQYFFWTWHCQYALVSTLHIPFHITFISPLWEVPSSTVLQEWSHRVISFYSIGDCKWKEVSPPNFNLKIVRIQCGNGSWMLLDALLYYWERYARPHLKNVIHAIKVQHE